MTESVLDLYGIDSDRITETIEKLNDPAPAVSTLLREMYRFETFREALPDLHEHSQEMRRSQVLTFFVVMEGARSVLAEALESFDTDEWLSDTDSVGTALEAMNAAGDALVDMIADLHPNRRD